MIYVTSCSHMTLSGMSQKIEKNQAEQMNHVIHYVGGYISSFLGCVMSAITDTTHPENYAHSLYFVVFCCG